MEFTRHILAPDTTPPAQPAVQEPIGYAVPTFDFDNSVIKKVHYAGTVPVYTTPPAQPAVQEPVAWMYPDDYERMLTSETFCTVYSVEVGSATRGESSVALYTTPPAQPSVPDAMTSADIQEHIEYVAGWNDCRAEMLRINNG
jgi:hypothetical protein